MVYLLPIYRRTKKTKGFTLVEVVLATSIFALVALVGVIIFVNVTRIQRRIALENALYEDGRFMMERLAREVRYNTIDYEEYYNKSVEKDPDNVLIPERYGAEYGCYASRFYNPGSDLEFGAKCNNGAPADQNLGCVIDKETLDLNVGQNPYFLEAASAGTANAFCDEKYGAGTIPGSCANASLHSQKELYLIDSAGKKKTLVALKTVNASGEKALSMIRLIGEDTNTDGIVEKWVEPGVNYYCDTSFDCNPNNFPNNRLEDSLIANTPSDIYKGFVPISPLRTNITDLKFYVSPLEDPRKAFAEINIADGSQQQPHVTILMSLQPSQSELGAFGEDIPKITLQTSISSRVYSEVKSYTHTQACSSGYDL